MGGRALVHVRVLVHWGEGGGACMWGERVLVHGGEGVGACTCVGTLGGRAVVHVCGGRGWWYMGGEGVGRKGVGTWGGRALVHVHEERGCWYMGGGHWYIYHNSHACACACMNTVGILFGETIFSQNSVQCIYLNSQFRVTRYAVYILSIVLHEY